MGKIFLMEERVRIAIGEGVAISLDCLLDLLFFQRLLASAEKFISSGCKISL